MSHSLLYSRHFGAAAQSIAPLEVAGALRARDLRSDSGKRALTRDSAPSLTPDEQKLLGRSGVASSYARRAEGLSASHGS